MLGSKVKLFCIFAFLTLTKAQDEPAELEEVLNKQRDFQAMITAKLEEQRQQLSMQMEQLMPNTEKLFKNVWEKYKSLVFRMRDQLQFTVDSMQPLMNADYDVQQLEVQSKLSKFFEVVLESIEYHTKQCLPSTALAVVDASPNQCSLQPFWPTACTDVKPKRSGVVRIFPLNRPHLVYCEQETLEGGWLVVLQRTSAEKNSLNTWHELETGFGTLCEADFFIGLSLLHELTAAREHELLFELKDYSNAVAYARYSEIEIGNAESGYIFEKLGEYSGNAGDSFRFVEGMKFATSERDVDECVSTHAIAGWHDGGEDCYDGNIFGNILPVDTSKLKSALMWPTFRPTAPLKEIRMLIRATAGFKDTKFF